MKAIKIILIILVVIIGGYSIWMSTLPSDYYVERSTTIDAKPEQVYATVSDFTTWKDWSKWHRMDPEMEVTYGDKSAGEGASYSWKGEKAGAGTQTITKAVPPSSMDTHIAFEGMGESDGHWKFEEVGENNTKVTWAFEGEFPFFLRVFNLGMDESVGADFEEGLANLKQVVEKNVADQKPSIDITQETVEAKNYYYTKHDISWQEMDSAFFADNYGKLMNFLGPDAANMTMPPFAVYHKWDTENQRVQMEVAIAADSKKAANGDIMKGMTYGGPAIKAIHVGGYDTEAEHEAMYEYVQSRDDMEMVGSPWEVFLNDPGVVKEESEWQVAVYYPVAMK